MNRKSKVETASNSASTYTGGITIKSAQELDAMRLAGSIVGDTLTLLKRSVEPGITTRELDNIAYKNITGHGAKPTFKGYRGFPGSICASVNEEIVPRDTWQARAQGRGHHQDGRGRHHRRVHRRCGDFRWPLER